jgi:hypothetical protein
MADHFSQFGSIQPGTPIAMPQATWAGVPGYPPAEAQGHGIPAYGWRQPAFQGRDELMGQAVSTITSLLRLLQAQPQVSLGGAPSPQALPGVAFPSPPIQAASDFERQVADGFLRDIISAMMRKLLDYFEKNSAQNGELQECYPLVFQAVQAFRERDYPQALNLVYQAYRGIVVLRSRLPDLPSLNEERGDIPGSTGQA